MYKIYIEVMHTIITMPLDEHPDKQAMRNATTIGNDPKIVATKRNKCEVLNNNSKTKFDR